MGTQPRDSNNVAVVSLEDACLKAAAAGDFWRVQRRVLEQLPEVYANRLLQLLLEQRVMTAPALDLFKYSVTCFSVPPGLRAVVAAEWLAYLADFRFLTELDLSLCTKLKDAHLLPLQRLHSSLQRLVLQGCKGVTAKATATLAHLTSLTHLDLSETGISQPISSHLSGLTALSSLLLGGLPISDSCCQQLAALKQLQNLVLWGSQITERSFPALSQLPSLTSLDISWSSADAFPVLKTVRHLNLSHCTVSKGWVDVVDTSATGQCPLTHLMLTCAQIKGEGQLVLEELLRWSLQSLQVLDLAGTQFSQLHLLQGSTSLCHLDVSGCHLTDAANLTTLLAASKLTHLKLNNTLVDPVSAAILGLVPKLEALELRNCRLVDAALPWLLHLTALTSLDLSHNTHLTGTLTSFKTSVGLDLPDELLPSLADAVSQGRVQLPYDVAAASRRLQGGLTLAAARFVNVWEAGGEGQAEESMERNESRLTHLLPPSIALLQQHGWSCLLGLQTLSAVDTAWSNEACVALAFHATLTALTLGSRHVTDHGLMALAKIPQLESLCLKQVRATDRAWACFKGHEKLKAVELHDCILITRARLQALWEDLPHLQTLTENGEELARSAQQGATPPRQCNSRDFIAKSNQKSPLSSQPARSPPLSSSPLVPIEAHHLRPYDQRFKYGRDELLELRDSSDGNQSCLDLQRELINQIPVEVRLRWI